MNTYVYYQEVIQNIYFCYPTPTLIWTIHTFAYNNDQILPQEICFIETQWRCKDQIDGGSNSTLMAAEQ